MLQSTEMAYIEPFFCILYSSVYPDAHYLQVFVIGDEFDDGFRNINADPDLLERLVII